MFSSFLVYYSTQKETYAVKCFNFIKRNYIQISLEYVYVHPKHLYIFTSFIPTDKRSKNVRMFSRCVGDKTIVLISRDKGRDLTQSYENKNPTPIEKCKSCM